MSRSKTLATEIFGTTESSSNSFQSSGVWPAPLRPAAYQGVLGGIVQAIAPQTEADPAAILLQLLTMFGSVIGRGSTFRVGADVHPLNLFVAIVGETGKARKGVSRGQAQRLFTAVVDEHWAAHCITAGLSSGEGLIWAIRDPIEKQQAIKDRGRILGYETVLEDPGISDKRLLVVETELASTLKVMMRDGSTLSAVLRQAWDGQDLRTLVKSSPARATAPHICVIGHITKDELRRYLQATECANGFGNRFLWVCARRSRELPDGGGPVALQDHIDDLARVVAIARAGGLLQRDSAARAYWHDIYGRLSAGQPGMLGAMTARAEAQVMRLSCLYALADGTFTVGLPHLWAALEVWRYCRQSAVYLFGDQVGDPTADSLLLSLRRVWPESLTRTELHHGFGRHKPASDLDRALQLLRGAHLADREQDRSGEGRPVERWFALTQECELSELSEISPEQAGVNSLNTLNSPPEVPHDGGF